MQASHQALSDSGYDYVLTSTTNHFAKDSTYLAPLSPTTYQLNYQQAFFDAEHVLSSSPKAAHDIHNVTPHPMALLQMNSKKKEPFNFESDNKQNIHANFDLFQPLEYEKLFDKNMNFSQMGQTSNKKSPLSQNSGNKSNISMNSSKNHDHILSSGKKSNKSISQLSNESKNFIQHSISKNIVEDSSESKSSFRQSQKSRKSAKNQLTESLKEDMKLLQFDFREAESMPVTSSNETIQTQQNQNRSEPMSSSHQQNTYSTREVNLRSIEEAENNQTEQDGGSEVPSFNQKPEVIDYFLTEEDDPNDLNNSEEGIQLLSELESELNSLINGSEQNSRASSNNGSKNGKTLHEIRSFGARSNAESAVSKRCNNACEELASKIQELKINILGLHSKFDIVATDVSQKLIDPQGDSFQELPNNSKNFKKGTNPIKKSPEIYLSKTKPENDHKKLIYHDSQIIFSRHDGQFVDFQDQFSKILGQSYDQNLKNSQSDPKFIPESKSSPGTLKKSVKQITQSKVQISPPTSQFGTERKSNQNEGQNFGTSNKNTSVKIQIEKEAFKMSFPKFYEVENDQDHSGNPGKSRSIDLGNSYLSSASNEGFMLNELQSKFNSKFNDFFQLPY